MLAPAPRRRAVPTEVAAWWNSMSTMEQAARDVSAGWQFEREVRRWAASEALGRLLEELERLSESTGGCVDYARLAREPTARWVAAEDALLDTCICKQEARDICEALDRHLITAAVTGSLRLIPGAAGKGPLPYRLDSQKSGTREGDVDVSAWKETHDTRRHWEKEPGHLVVWCGQRFGRRRSVFGGPWPLISI